MKRTEVDESVSEAGERLNHTLFTLKDRVRPKAMDHGEFYKMFPTASRYGPPGILALTQ